MPDDLVAKSAEELLQIKLTLESDIDSIRAQIDAAQAKARETGEFADSDWWGRAKWALKSKGRQCQQIQLLLRQKNKAAQGSLENCFMTTARELLPAEQFQAILDTARLKVG